MLTGFILKIINYGILEVKIILLRRNMILVQMVGVFLLVQNYRNYVKILLHGSQMMVWVDIGYVAQVHMAKMFLRFFSLQPDASIIGMGKHIIEDMNVITIHLQQTLVIRPPHTRDLPIALILLETNTLQRLPILIGLRLAQYGAYLSKQINLVVVY